MSRAESRLYEELDRASYDARYLVLFRDLLSRSIYTDKYIMMFDEDFQDLSEYSSSLPSGVYLHKVWKARRRTKWGTRWVMGHYAKREGKDMLIRWRDIILRPNPASSVPGG